MDEKVISKKFFFIILVLFCCLFLAAGSAQANYRTEKAEEKIGEAHKLAELKLIDQAKEKMNKAHELLLSELSRNSDNLEAYFLLGQCEFILKPDKHFQKFEILYKKDKSYGPKIYDFYMDMVEMARERAGSTPPDGRLVKIRLLAALEYYPEKADQVMEELIKESMQYVENGEFKSARAYLKEFKEIAGEKYKDRIAKAYLERGKALSEEGRFIKGVNFFDFARGLSDKFDSELASLCFEYGKKTEDVGDTFFIWSRSLASSPKHKDDIIEAAALIFEEIKNESGAKVHLTVFPDKISKKIREKANSSN